MYSVFIYLRNSHFCSDWGSFLLTIYMPDIWMFCCCKHPIMYTSIHVASYNRHVCNSYNNVCVIHFGTRFCLSHLACTGIDQCIITGVIPRDFHLQSASQWCNQHLYINGLLIPEIVQFQLIFHTLVVRAPVNGQSVTMLLSMLMSMPKKAEWLHWSWSVMRMVLWERTLQHRYFSTGKLLWLFLPYLY